MKTSFETQKYKGYYFSLFLGVSFFYSFFSLYLNSLGYSPEKIGTVLSILTAIGAITMPLWAVLGRDLDGIRRLLPFILIGLCISSILVIVFKQYYAVLLIAGLYSFFRSPSITYLDSMTSSYLKNVTTPYSSLRLFGSFAFIVVTIVGGFIIDIFGFNMMYLLSAISFFVAAVVAFTVKPVVILDEQEKEKGNYKQLLSNRFFIRFLISQALINVVCSTLDAYAPLYFSHINIPVSNIGLMLGINLFAEVAGIILIGNFLKKMRPSKYHMICAIVAIIRCMLYAFSQNHILMFVSMTLNGICNAFFIVFIVRYLILVIRQHNLGIAFITNALWVYLCSSVMMYVAGFIVERFSFKVLFLFFIAVLTCGFICAYIFDRAKHSSMVHQENM